MKSLLLLFSLFLFPALLFSQSQSGVMNQDGLPVPCVNYQTQGGSGSAFTQTQLPTARQFHRESSNLRAASSVSGLGFGGVAMFNQQTGADAFTQFGSGYINIPDRQSSNIGGRTITGSVIPLFIGKRFNLAATYTNTFTWTQYAQFGGGPLLGVEFPNTYGFWQSISRIGFRWGGGLYAGVGSEVRFTEGWGGFAQLELDTFGFLSPLNGRTSYIGPSFSFGIQRFIW